MFSLDPTSSSSSKGKKKKADPRAKLPLDRKGRKQAKQFSKGVTRFLRYNKDLLEQETYEEIATLQKEFDSKVPDQGKKRSFFEEKADGISKACKKAIPDFQPSVMKENIEVLFVAVVIAMGIRAYFVQQFKIPTGSMQPTLNGIIAYTAPESEKPGYKYKAPADYQRPNPIQRLVDSVWFGRSHIEWRAKEDNDAFLLQSEKWYGKNRFILFPRTYLITEKGHKYVAAGTKNRARLLICDEKWGKPLKKGELFARGYIETGDMLIVNKLAYHWRKPKRGEVFVFNTRDIPYIQNSINPRYGSQHYIKRLCGVPGDHIKIEQPNLIVNGKPAEEFGIRRVMSQEGYYDGYLEPTRSFEKKEFKLGPEQYIALGDNSGNSADSRSFGTVPERNIVGKAMFVFYPFGNHFGPIR